LQNYRIHGDNIVECERTLTIIIDAFKDYTLIRIDGPLHSVVCPSYIVEFQGLDKMTFTFFPGYGRWKVDILDLIKSQGGKLREATDAILTKVINTTEKPLLAIEYCGALPAGNQAWQRSGRGLSCAQAQIPYVFVTEIGGFELTAEREKKSARMPNPAVPYSYIRSSNRYQIPCLPVYVPNVGGAPEIIEEHRPYYGESELKTLLRCFLTGENPNDVFATLKSKSADLLVHLVEQKKRTDGFDLDDWKNAVSIEDDASFVDFVKQKDINWSKTAYIKGLTSSAKTLMELTAKYAKGLTSKQLPFCIIDSTNRPDYAQEVQALYDNNLPDNFTQWLCSNGDLAICFIMGFKPKGDDARPDRGLAPFLRMLIGENVDLMTIVYGPAKESAWNTLVRDMDELARSNGLWEAILNLSDAILIDSETDTDITQKGYVLESSTPYIANQAHNSYFVPPMPEKFGENDVDTTIHNLLYKIANWGSNSIISFEGMCNPPGGDWSGISLINTEGIELRWLSLPRVSASEAKRPDHVIQFFESNNVSHIFVVESKDKRNALEPQIGERLKRYISDLLQSNASVEKDVNGNWIPSEKLMQIPPDAYISGVAFRCIDINKMEEELDASLEFTQTDISMAIHFNDNGDKVTIGVCANQRGSIILNLLHAFAAKAPTLYEIVEFNPAQ